MRGLLRNVAFLIVLFFFVTSCHATSTWSSVKNDLIHSWQRTDADTVQTPTGQQLELDSLETDMHCGGRDLPSTPRCIHYEYFASGLVEAFIIDRHQYQKGKTEKQDLASTGVILPGSYCIGQKCELTANLNGVQDWCLMFMNIDPNLNTTLITFQYQVCIEKDNKNDLILILSAVCVGLVAVTLVACIGCCWMMRRRNPMNDAKEPKKEERIESTMNIPFIPPPPLPPNSDVLYSMPPPPPMVSHGPYRHEPLFQVQPPLPISHVPPPPTSTQPSTSSAQEIHVQFPPTEKKTRSKSKSKIRFPI